MKSQANCDAGLVCEKRRPPARPVRRPGACKPIYRINARRGTTTSHPVPHIAPPGFFHLLENQSSTKNTTRHDELAARRFKSVRLKRPGEARILANLAIVYRCSVLRSLNVV